ncbi:MAG: ElyC/SanA/YdcF family protein [Deltaproteobacteria bacterium]|nr:ElyC/SanA/YdcF family protein [Myxococcales bacterium]MDP3212526.1 ElyC/SanA/YdcF family protein [Deltaproteobacteria bacterium]
MMNPSLRRAALALAAVAALTASVNVWVETRGASRIHPLDGLSDADAVIVLGARVYADGSVSPMLADRLDAALALYRAGKAPRILVSGDHGTESYDEVNAMRRYLEARGVPAAHIFMDHAGFTTYDTLYRARDVFGVRRAVVVTQRFHLTRSLFVANALGLDAEGFVADRRPYTLGSLVRSNVREVGARVKAAVQALATPRPRYLGPRIPIGGDGRVTRG